MPTVFIVFGLRFMFFANDHEPVHVHVVKENAKAKFSLLPEVKLIYNHGLKASDLKKARTIITDNATIIIERWNDFFNSK
ncbi:MAG: DUF4160 domain-containing protein [Tannerella sp.]|jgi:hypothetical protein|nr:DUF4160 domain-containing protein [Tannerella sp.]